MKEKEEVNARTIEIGLFLRKTCVDFLQVFDMDDLEMSDAWLVVTIVWTCQQATVAIAQNASPCRRMEDEKVQESVVLWVGPTL